MPDSKKRISYSLQFKLSVASEYKKDTIGRGYHALATKYKVSSSSMVRDWVVNRQKLEKTAEDRHFATRSLRRLPGAGRKAEHHEMESELHNWIATRNRKGLRVKDRYIRLQLFAASQFHSCNIEVKTLSEDCKVISTFTYSVPEATRTVCVARIGPYFALQVNGMHVEWRMNNLHFGFLPVLSHGFQYVRLGVIQEYNA